MCHVPVFCIPNQEPRALVADASIIMCYYTSPVRFPLAVLVDARIRSVGAPARVPVHL